MPDYKDRFGDTDLDWITIDNDEDKEKALMEAKEKQRVMLRAKRALGQMKKKSASDKRIFIEQCVDSMTSSGDAEDEDEARDICLLLWEEGDEYADD